MVAHVLLTSLGLPMLLAALIAIPLVALIGVVIEFLVVRPMWNCGAAMFAIILATLVAQIMIERITILTADGEKH
jgi:branched-chain amino acid transport system permease protein